MVRLFAENWGDSNGADSACAPTALPRRAESVGDVHPPHELAMGNERGMGNLAHDHVLTRWNGKGGPLKEKGAKRSAFPRFTPITKYGCGAN